MIAELSTQNITIEKSIVDKLLDKDEISKQDIKQLHMFNDDYIDRLLAAGQTTARYKVAEALIRGGIIEVI